MNRKPASNNSLKFLLLIPIILCSLVGVFTLFNASGVYGYNHFNNEYYFVINQLIWLTLGCVIFIFVQFIPLRFIPKISMFLFSVAIFLLIFALLPTPFSHRAYGASRWVMINPEPFPLIPFIGRLTLQPSELSKLSAVLFFPFLLSKCRGLKKQNEIIYKYLFYVVFNTVFILLEPDFKSTLIILVITGGILFTSGINLKYFFYLGVILVPMLVSFVFLSNYRMDRLKAYLGDSNTESAYHVRQLKIALGSGGVFGVGLGQSRQKMEYLPEVMADSIYAIIGEEFGFIGSVSLLILITFTMFVLLKSVFLISVDEYKLVAVGVLCWFGIQSFLNIGSVTGVIPLTGVPLPLISYGGSSLLFLLVGFSFVYKFLDAK